jgi:hypothetical protein
MRLYQPYLDMYCTISVSSTDACDLLRIVLGVQFTGICDVRMTELMVELVQYQYTDPRL